MTRPSGTPNYSIAPPRCQHCQLELYGVPPDTTAHGAGWIHTGTNREMCATGARVGRPEARTPNP